MTQRVTCFLHHECRLKYDWEPFRLQLVCAKIVMILQMKSYLSSKGYLYVRCG